MLNAEGHILERLVQLSDLHLFCDESKRLKQIPTYQTFADVVANLATHHNDFDWMVVTGDLAHDESEGAYRALRRLLEPWLHKVCLLPGNHDNRRHIRNCFPELFESPEPWLTFSLACAGWRLIGLDSQLTGEVSGYLDPEQLNWLREELEEYSQQPTILFMHHPPVSIGISWLDNIGLTNASEFEEVVLAAGQVQAICTGHVHQCFQGQLGSARVFTTPSTSVQFSSTSDEPAYVALPPGYRLLDLESGSLKTEVVRLGEVKFHPANENE